MYMSTINHVNVRVGYSLPVVSLVLHPSAENDEYERISHVIAKLVTNKHFSVSSLLTIIR